MGSTQSPSWIEQVVRVAASGVKAQGLMGPLGWTCNQPPAPGQPWEIAIYPTPCEVYAGPMDGKLIKPGYLWNISEVVKIFDQIPYVAWASPVARNDNYLGSEVFIRGTVNRADVWLRLFNTPPVDEKPTVIVDPDKGQIWRPGEAPPGLRKKKKKRRIEDENNLEEE